MAGSLVHNDYLKLFKDKNIIGKYFDNNQIQPSSIDLSLSDECYELKYSFLSHNKKVRDKLNEFSTKKIDLSKKYKFKVNKTYIVRLREKLFLNNEIFGKCNPKSSTGRLDIFCRTIVDYSDEYEKIPYGYNGEIFLEITSRSFDIEFIEGNKLNQVRLINKKHNNLNDKKIIDINKKFIKNNLLSYKNINNGLKISVNLEGVDKIVAYRAKKKSPTINYSKIQFYKPSNYWDALKSVNNKLVIEKNRFYILKSKEKVIIPNGYAGEMVPYDTGIGDFRAHYAGFFDPGFGVPGGSYAVLEVKTNEIPFILEDGQTIARIKYEKLNKNSKVLYGTKIKSNYQFQNLNLSKHFKQNNI